MDSNEPPVSACLWIKKCIKLVHKNQKLGREAHFESSVMHLDLQIKANRENSHCLFVCEFTRNHKNALVFPSQMGSEEVIKSKCDDNWVSTGPHVALKSLDKTNEKSA